MTPLYYYTSTETMKHILTGGNMFATNIRYMNDADEYLIGVKEIQDILREKYVSIRQDKRIKINENTTEINSFSISFSVSEDLLSQWAIYAGESGVNLQMDFTRSKIYEITAAEKLVGKIKVKNKTPRSVYYFSSDAIKKVNKLEGIKDEIEKEAVKTMNGDLDNWSQVCLSMAPLIKRYDFSAEGEHRLIFGFDEMLDRPLVNFRMDKKLLKPYLDLACTEEVDAADFLNEEDYIGWPIEQIIVGPGFNQDEVFNSIKYFLENSQLKLLPKTDEEYLAKFIIYLKSLKFKNKDTLIKAVEAEKMKADPVRKRLNYAERRDRQKRAFGLSKNNLDNVRDSYFSSYGIILKKSKIPYIY